MSINSKRNEFKEERIFYIKRDFNASVRFFQGIKLPSNETKAIFFYKSHFKNPLKNPASYLVEAGI